jgi:hypothetical protein
VRGDPFWGFDTVRGAMARGGRGPTWTLLVFGLVLIGIGIVQDGVLLVAIGLIVGLIGLWPVVAGFRSRRTADRLAEHARREDEILEAARRIVNEAAGPAAGRGDLAALIAADPSAADVARRDCLRRAGATRGDERDAWLDAANEIGRLRAPEEIPG